MARRAFTLIELLVIVAIMATMVTVSVVSIRAGQSTARIKGATRNVMAAIRNARSRALVMMQPAIVTYSTTTIDDEVCAQIEVEGAKFTASQNPNDVVETLSGEPVHRNGTPVKRNAKSATEEGEPLLSEDSGQTVEDILFSPISTEVVRGVRIKVAVGDELVEFADQEEKSANKISVFSNVDYLLGKYKEQKQQEKKKPEEETSSTSSASSPSQETQEPVRIVWEANGRCDPHRVWVYLDGSTPDKGLCIKVDHFGAAKVVSDED